VFEKKRKFSIPVIFFFVFLCSLWAWADIQPVSDIVVSRQAGNPEQIWLNAVQVNDLEILADQLVTGTSTGTATAGGPPYSDITNADNLDLNLFAARNNEEPAEWRITNLGGHALYWDTNGEQPDFVLFETNGNDDILVQAILPDGSLGHGLDISKSTWGDTGLLITASVHKNQRIAGLTWSLTDLLDTQGLPLTGDQSIAGILITSPGLDPACFCAVQGSAANQSPQVEAGESLSLFVPDNAAVLAGTVTDDGLGDPNGYLFYQWAWKEGPGQVIFEPNSFVLSPSVTLMGGPGVYVLELIASDGVLESADQLTINLQSSEMVGRVVINELLGTDDPGAQETGDWVELYNPGHQPVDIAGYYLTDDQDDPMRWRVPGGNPTLTTIASGKFLRIWADGGLKPGLHAGFELDSQGETVALHGPDGLTQVDMVTYDKLPGGIAWGREPDGSERWVTLVPSPGQSNHGFSLPLVADTKFSVDRGFFETPFGVIITCATEGATIVYTTDSSEPTLSHGIEGTAQVTVTISTTTVLRVMAYKDGMRATNVDTQTYLFLSDVIQQPANVPGCPNPRTWLGGSAYDNHDYEMDPGIVQDADYRAEIILSLLAIPTMSIAVEPEELASENGFYWGSGEAPCSMELIFPDDPNENVHVNAGVEPHSHDRLKRSLRLNFRSEYGDAKLKTSLMRTGSLYGDSATDTFDRLILRGGNNRCWARVWNPDKTAYTIDQFYRDSQIELSGYGSRGAFVHLYINGLYWGLYNPVERTDQWFAAEYFDTDPEDWFAVHHGSQGAPGFNGDGSRFQTLVNDLIKRDLTQADHYALTCAYIDTENFCDYMLFTWWMGVGDWPGNNWYAGCRTDSSPLGPTPLRFFAWDGEWSWDASRAGGPGYVHPDFRSNKNGGSVIPKIWHALRMNEDFMTLFADRVYQHFFHKGTLTEEVAQQRWLKINEQIRSAVVAESARWGDAMKNQGQPTRTRNEDWRGEVDTIYNMIQGNSRQFLDHLRQQGYYPMIDPPEFSERDTVLLPEHELWLTNPNESGVVYYTTDNSDPRCSAPPVDVEVSVLVDEDALKYVLVPELNINQDWRGLRAFDDSLWIPGSGGVGYETNSGYESYIGIDTEALMFQNQASCYIRIPFQFEGDPYALGSFILSMRYDDGFIAYLNGVEMARANIAGTPTWQSSSSSSHSDGDAVVLEQFNLNAAREHLRTGDNILAIHGLNSSITSSDFLISAELEARWARAPVHDDLSPGVQIAQGPVVLPYSCQVKTRVLDGSTWSALNKTTLGVGPVADSLRISEIMYHPQNTGNINDPNTEFIELTNIGSNPINLNLVRFTKGVTFTFPAYDLDPGAHVLVVKEKNAFAARYPGDMPIAGQYEGSLNNGGERIVLMDAVGQPIVDFKYEDGWYPVTDGQGQSLEVKSPASTLHLGELNAWQPSHKTGGTPGSH